MFWGGRQGAEAKDFEMSSTDMKSEDAFVRTTASKQSFWTRKRIIIVSAVMFVTIIGLAIGLGVGLTVGHNSGHGGDDSASTPTFTPSSNSSNTVSANIWKPTAGTTWDLILSGPNQVLDSQSVQAYDIDLFDNTNTTIQQLHFQGKKVICYFSAGSYEDWRSDKNEFLPSDLGHDLDGWPGEKWLNTSSSQVRRIMKERLDVAAAKSCDGVDPDNVDAYNNANNGLGLTADDAIDYILFLATEAHNRGLAIGLKNAGEIIPSVIDQMQWTVNEQCTEYNECATWSPFIMQDKPVFHVEYPKGDATNSTDSVTDAQKQKACGADGQSRFSSIIKNMNLDKWIEDC